MRLYARRMLLLVSCIAFAIIAPLIVLYAMGYRPGISSPLSPPVGVAIIEATPRKATVQVNGTLIGTLPRSIPNLLPGTTHIRVTKEGYTPWGKNIEIRPATATDVRSILLTPSIFDRDILLSDSRVFATSPTSSRVAIVHSNKKLTIYDDTGLTITNQLTLSRMPIELLWSPDGSYLLASFPKKTYELFHMEGNAVERIKGALPKGSAHVQWNPREIGTLFFLNESHSLVSYNAFSGMYETIMNSIATYATHNRNIIIQTLDNVLVTKQGGTASTTVILPDTKKSIQNIIPGGNGFIALLFSDGQLQMVTTKGELRHVAFNVRKAIWSKSGTTLLIQSSSEDINVYIPEGTTRSAIPAEELHLVVRLSRPIMALGWLPDSQHILYEANGDIILSEIDTRDYAITHTIQQDFVPNTHVTIEQDGKSILALQKVGGKQSLVRTWLVTKEDR